MDNVLLSVSNLSIRKGKEEAVRSSSFSVFRGEITALVGESGAGKSLTALALSGLLPAGFTASGSIVFSGRELLTSPEDSIRLVRGRGISLMLQSAADALNPVYRIGQQVRTVLRINGRDSSEENIRRILSEAGIEEAYDRYPHELSGGMGQRALTAIAMAPGPELLVADEITSSLDDDTAHMIMDLVRNMAAEWYASVLMITHDLKLASEYASYIAVMHGGYTVEEGTAEDVLSSPMHPYTSLLLRCASLEKDESGRLFSIPGKMPSPYDPVPGCSFSSRCPYRTVQCDHPVPVKREGSHSWRCING